MAPITKRRSTMGVDALERDSPDPRGDKRLRLSTEPSESTEENSGDEERRHNPQVVTQTQPHRPIQSQADFEAMRDENSGDEAGGDERRKLEKMKRDMAQHMDNVARENGIIESITCINFMCHKHLHLTLGPLINFIIGHNGSGKSAVLTALTVCLGGKATSTNRGQNLKSFIREGQDSATLIVKIKNQGESAYRPEIYGNSIVVERHFARTGASSFKIKNDKGGIVSTKKSELEEIADFYAFQLDNPVNVLTQDMARQFLNNSSEADKYKFFIRGVQLEQLNNDYTLVWESLNYIEAQLENVTENCSALKRAAEEAGAKFKQLSRQNQIREKHARYGRQMAWAQVEEQERNLEDLETKVREADAEIARRQAKSEEHASAYEQANTAHTEAMSVRDNLNESLEPLQQEEEVVQSKVDKHHSDMERVQAEQRSIKSYLDSAKKRIKDTKQGIADERRRLEAGDHPERIAEVEEAEREAVEAKKELEEHPASLPGLQRASVSANQESSELHSALTQKRRELEKAQDRLRGLEQDGQDTNKSYPPQLPSFQRAIESETRWHQKPIGPIGSYVRLMKPEWSSIFESTFGAVLNGFIVTNKHDEQILSDISRRTKYTCHIYITRANPIDTSAYEPDPKFETMMRALKFDNELVRKQLIIGQSIEQIIIIKDRKEAWETMFRSSPRVQHAKAVLCFHDHSKGHGHRLSQNNAVERFDPIEPYAGNARLKTDVDAQIRMQQEIVQSLKQEVVDVENRHRQANANATRSTQAITRHGVQLKELKLKSQAAEEKFEILKASLEEDTPEDGKLDSLKEKLQNAEEDQETYQNQYDESRRIIQENDSKDADLKKELEEAKAQVSRTQRKIEKAIQKIGTVAAKRGNALKQKNESIASIADAEENKGREEVRRDEMAEHVQNFIEEATKVCNRVSVDPGQTAASLDKKLDELQKQLQRAENELGGNPEQIAQRATEAKKAWQRAKKNMETLMNLEETLRQSISQRSYRWRKFRSSISSRARVQFIYLMSERAFKGNLRLDHAQKLLELKVQPDNTVRGRNSEDGRQTKTLSGGEKSFSTICLLLSLWDAMGSPIRCLDEFDVFMDNVNREQSMKMMIQAARRSVGRQFILITPQSMTKLHTAPDVKIIKLSDPERGQASIGVDESGLQVDA